MTCLRRFTRRLWRLSDGAELAVLRGHMGRGVWRVAVHGDRLATAGADASIKLWSLREALWQNGSSSAAGGDRGRAAARGEEGKLQTLQHCPSPKDAGEPTGGAPCGKFESLMCRWQPHMA